jgi:hypothetical protein
MLLKTFFSLTGSNVVVIWKRADGFSHSFLIDGGRPLERERLFLRCRSATHRPGDRGGVSSGLQDFETSPSADGVQFDRCGVTDGSGRINAGLLTART